MAWQPQLPPHLPHTQSAHLAVQYLAPFCAGFLEGAQRIFGTGTRPSAVQWGGLWALRRHNFLGTSQGVREAVAGLMGKVVPISPIL